MTANVEKSIRECSKFERKPSNMREIESEITATDNLGARSFDWLLKRYKTVLAITAFALFTLYACLLVPMYVQLNADTLYRDGIIVDILYYAQESIDYIVFFAVYPITVYSIYARGFKKSGGLMMIYPLAVVYKYIANYIASCITDGALPSADVFLGFDIWYNLTAVLIEVGQYMLIALWAHIIFTNVRRVFAVREKAAIAQGHSVDFRDEVFPMTRLFNLKNPMQKALLYSAVTVSALRILMYAVYQFTLIVYNGFNDGWGGHGIELVSDLFIGAIGYLAMVLIAQTMDAQYVKKRAELESEARNTCDGDSSEGYSVL